MLRATLCLCMMFCCISQAAPRLKLSPAMIKLGTVERKASFPYTLTQNILVNRAFSRELLERIDFEANSDDFVFDNQMLSQII